MAEKFYCLADKYCVFLQTGEPVKLTDTGGNISSEDTPLLAKKNGGQYQYVKLEKTEAFILRLLLQPLPISLVSQALIWKSSGQLPEKEADSMVHSVITRYMNEGYLQAVEEIDSDIQKIKLTRKDILDQHEKAKKAEKGRQARMAAGKAMLTFKRLDYKAFINQPWPSIFKVGFPPFT